MSGLFRCFSRQSRTSGRRVFFPSACAPPGVASISTFLSQQSAGAFDKAAPIGRTQFFHGSTNTTRHTAIRCFVTGSLEDENESRYSSSCFSSHRQFSTTTGSNTDATKPLMSFSKEDVAKGAGSYFDDDDNDDDDDDEKEGIDGVYDPQELEHKEMLKRKAVQRKFFENKKGRGWSDPLAMEPFFEANPQYEDVPDWHAEAVSATSRERVQILEEGIPTLSKLARLPLPTPVHINPEKGQYTEYLLYKHEHFQKQLAKRIRIKAEPEVKRIQSLENWEEKQQAVDELFEKVEAELKVDEVILGKHPFFGGWVENALEEFLVEIDDTSKNALYQKVVNQVRSIAVPKVESISKMKTFPEKEKEASAMFDMILSIEAKDQLGKHPLFREWIGKALEDYVNEMKSNAEGAMLEKILENTRSKAMDKLQEIQKLSNDDKPAALEELYKSTKEELAGTTFEAKDYHFTKWLKKVYYDHLYHQVLAMVRSAAEQFDTFSDQDSQRRYIHLRSKILKQQMEQDNFPLSKHENFVIWVKQALEEYLDNSQDDMFQQVQSAVVPKAASHVDRIKTVQPLNDRWAAVDELSNSIQNELATEKFDLAGNYQFAKWVKKALKEHLQEAKALPDANDMFSEETIEAPIMLVKRAIDQQLQELEAPDKTYPTQEQDEEAVPVFMDVYSPECTAEQNVPDILRPLKWYPRSKQLGKMMEEWELAANKTTKRIMLRQATRKIAQLVEKGETVPQRVFVHGKQGVGKTAALAAVVAAARKSGHIVYYVPDSRMLYEHGYYNTPNKNRPGMFDLPMLCQEQCQILLDTHRSDLEGMVVDRETMNKFFTEKRMETMGDQQSLVEILELSQEAVAAAAACFSCTMEVLYAQEEKPFTVVVDEANIFFKRGKYYHMEYDFDVKKPIPYMQLNLFEHMLKALGLSVNDDGEEILTPQLMKKGSIVVATSAAHGVKREINETLLENAQESSKLFHQDAPLTILEMPRLSKLEVEHMLAHYETVGLGRLRMDEGATVNNPVECNYLRVVSGSIPQKLMDVCIMV